VLLGTLYPLALDALGQGKISVGPPYFDTVFVPLMAPLVFLIGVGPIARWKQAELPDLATRLRWALAVTVVAALLAAWIAGRIAAGPVLGLLMAFWIVASVATDLLGRLRPKLAGGSVVERARLLPRAWIGMTLAHLGVAAFIVGVTMVRSYEVERDVRMAPGDTTELAGFRFTFRGANEITGPNYVAMRGSVDVERDGRVVAQMFPEKRIYRVQQNPMTEAAIHSRPTRDLYVSLGEAVDGGAAWIVRVYYKPFVTWIWGGCLLMGLGGLVAATDRRYRAPARREREAAVAAGAVA
jgi:cytochrome c-type biogenesis protein CcmF